MSRFKNTSSGDVIHVPDELDAMYGARPGFVTYDPDAPVSAADLAAPGALAPAGSTGSPAPTFDPAQPLAAGPAVALENIEDIKGDALQETLTVLGLDTKGTADEKRDRLADRLNEEVDRG